MNAEPAPEPLATVKPIHGELIRKYNDAHNAAYWKMLREQQDASLDMLVIIREEAAGSPGSRGLDTVMQRARRDGWIAALDELIEGKTP